MGYTRHLACTEPEPRDPDKIWRYMDFTQFVHLLENKELFFPRANNMDDPYEGTIPNSQEEKRHEILNEKSATWAVQLLPKLRKVIKRYTFLSCWHMNGGESAAMWDIYLNSDQGVCIQSSFESLRDSMDTDEDVFISKVKYVDYAEVEIPGWEGLADTISPFIYKRDAFKHESELRAIIHDLPWYQSGGTGKITVDDIRDEDLENGGYEPGRSVSVDLDELIESIRVSPEAGSWVETLVEDVCDEYGLDTNLIDDSPMDQEPHH